MVIKLSAKKTTCPFRVGHKLYLINGAYIGTVKRIVLGGVSRGGFCAVTDVNITAYAVEVEQRRVYIGYTRTINGRLRSNPKLISRN